LQIITGIPPWLGEFFTIKGDFPKAKDKQKCLCFCQERGFKHPKWIAQLMLELSEWANPWAPCFHIPHLSFFFLPADSHNFQATEGSGYPSSLVGRLICTPKEKECFQKKVTVIPKKQTISQETSHVFEVPEVPHFPQEGLSLIAEKQKVLFS